MAICRLNDPKFLTAVALGFSQAVTHGSSHMQGLLRLRSRLARPTPYRAAAKVRYRASSHRRYAGLTIFSSVWRINVKVACCVNVVGRSELVASETLVRSTGS